MKPLLNRRQFLRGALASGALWGVGINSPRVVRAQTGDFRALICIQQGGGCDNFLFSIPTDTARKNALIARRGPYTTNYYSDPDLVQLGYNTQTALHPRLKPLEAYLGNLRLTLGVSNAMHVPASGSHEIQQIRMSLGTEIQAGQEAGWKARLLDTADVRLIGFNGARSQDFACSSARCEEHPPLVTNTFGEYNLNGASFNYITQGGSLNSQFTNFVAGQIAQLHPEGEGALSKKFRMGQRGMLAAVSDVRHTLEDFITPKYAQYAPLFNPGVDYSGYLLAIRFRDIAQQLMRLRDEGSSSRIIFTVPHGGYDNHADFAIYTNSLMNNLGKVLRLFLDDLVAMGIFDNVVIQTETEFGRQIISNGTGAGAGTDHGVAFSTLTLGGRVRGGANAMWGEMLSTQIIETQYGWPRVLDYRAIVSEIVEQHLGLNPLTTAFAGPIGNEFSRTSLSLFS